MRIWNTAVDNKVAVYILILIIVIIGADAYMSMPRESAPDITIPLIIVSVPYPGVSPTDIEGLISQPLERELKTIKDVKMISSSSKEGFATVQVEFNTDVEIDDALRRVRDKVNSTKPKLPTDILEPIVSEINFSEFPIMYVAIGGNVGLARLKAIADDLKDEIETVPGVLSSDITGNLEPEIQVNVDVNRMNGYEISFDDITNAIRNENLTMPGGAINNGTTEYSVRIPGEYKDPRLISDIVVKMRNGSPIYMRDVANVEYSFEDRISYSRLNGEPVVTLTVKKRAGENLIQIADRVKEIVDQARTKVPSGVSLVITGDQSIQIKRSVFELENSILTGMFLVVIVLFMFFGVKNAALISTAIPLSMLIGFIILSAMGITLNFVVLFALVLVLGILVDDAIVVIENIYRHQQEFGQDLITAAKEATREVAVPVATATFTTVAAFLPMLFWPGVVGDFMSYLPITLISTLTGSLIVAYVISPVQGSNFINYRKEIEKTRQIMQNKNSWRRYNPFTRIYHWVDEVLFPAAQRKYVNTLRWTLQHKGLTMAGTFGILVFVFVLFSMFNAGVEFFPNVEPQLVNVDITMPSGTPLEMTNEAMKLVEERVKNVPGRKDIEYKVANVGISADPFDVGGQGTANKARYSLNFFEKAMREQSSFQTLDEVREVIGGVAGADIIVEEQQMGPPVGAPVSIEISGEDFTTLRSLSEQIQNTIRNVDGLVDLKDDYNEGRPEVQIIVDREKAALLEMSTGQIASVVRTAINGTEASKYRVGEDEYKITVRLQENQRESLNAIENLNVTFMNKKGKLLSVPLVSVATIVKSSGLTAIKRKDLNRVITVTGNNQGRLSNDVLNDVKTKLASFALPAGYEITFSGENEEQAKAASFLFKALMITLLLVFMILVAEFNSVKVPFVIMASVLLSLIGVLMGLIVTQTPFGVLMTGVGVVSLAGIVVKNAIVLLDFTKHLRGSGLSLDESLLEAGRTRLRPVVLTAVTTILGVLPLAVGVDWDWRNFHLVIGAESSDFWRPLGISIISGLLVSTFLTLVVVPTLYSWLDEKMKGLALSIRRLFGRNPEPVATPQNT